MLVAAEDFAQGAFAAVAHHRAADSPRGRDAKPGRLIVASFAYPQQEPPSVEPAPVLARDAEIGAAADALRRPKEEAALRGVRQR